MWSWSHIWQSLLPFRPHPWCSAPSPPTPNTQEHLGFGSLERYQPNTNLSNDYCHQYKKHWFPPSMRGPPNAELLSPLDLLGAISDPHSALGWNCFMGYPEAIQWIKTIVLMTADWLTVYRVKIWYPMKKSLYLTQWSFHFLSPHDFFGPSKLSQTIP